MLEHQPPEEPKYTKEEMDQMEKELEEYNRFAEGLAEPPTFFEWKKYYKK